MPGRESIEAFVAMVEARQYDLAIERFYAEDATMQENFEAPRKGRTVLVEGERRVMANFKEIRARCVTPVFIDGDYVVIRWQFEFVDAAGAVRQLDELALQRWEGERVAEERFYYDPAQLRG
ncbi:MAG: nuclear transport factor 2 family protein [Rhizomicrobium sp.]|jgi:hypothetical protein